MSQSCDRISLAIPDDLVLIPDAYKLTPQQFDQVLNAKWFKAGNVLLVSMQELNPVESFELSDPVDAGIDLTTAAIEYIPHCLHRYDEMGIWYHS